MSIYPKISQPFYHGSDLDVLLAKLSLTFPPLFYISAKSFDDKRGLRQEKMLQILALDLDGHISDGLERLSGRLSCAVNTVENHYEIVLKCQENQYDVLFVDLDHPRSGSLEELEQVCSLAPSMKCFVVTSLPQWEQAVAAIKAGAEEYLAKPLHPDRLHVLLSGLAKRPSPKVLESCSGLDFQKSKRIIGQSQQIQRVYQLIQKLARVETSVLIRGESGTGKELVAQALHYNSPRKNGPFVAVNCGAIPENLIESELFGFEKGTFTGADRKRLGKFQFAQGGTIFLDEIGDVSPQVQVKLLRVLQERKIAPVGSNQEIPIDVRVISATNRNLEKMMQDEKFRSDLYYRLNVMPIQLPPLRERTEDLADLAQFMIEKFNRLHNRDIEGLDLDALRALSAYDWPGNIRELENVIEHAFIIEGTSRIHLDSLPPSIAHRTTPTSGSAHTQPASEQAQASLSDFEAELRHFEELAQDGNSLKYPELKEQFEKEFLKRALKAFNGRINQTAEQTQMTKVTLLRKLEKYNINPKEFQHGL